MAEAPPVAGQAPAAQGAGRFGLASPPTALALGGLALLFCAAALVTSHAVGEHVTSSLDGITLFAVFTATGVVVAWHRPGNPLGWLMAVAGSSLAVTATFASYTVLDYRMHHGALPLGPAAIVLHILFQQAGLAVVGVIFLLFPDGRLPSPGWRWVLWGYLAAAAVWVGGGLAITANVITARGIRVDRGGNLLALDHPAGAAAWWGVAQTGFLILLGAVSVAWLGWQAVSFRSSAGERRQQLKVLLFGAAVCIACSTVYQSLNTLPGIWGTIGYVVGFGTNALPVSIGVAILKYRLYDIDRIISRTLAYTIVTGLLAGVYVGLVLLATQVLSVSSPVAVAASTLAAAALFSPLRQRVQRVVDRRFNRARYDADQTIAAFAARLKDAVDLDAVRGDLVQVVSRVLEPAHASVWISQHE
jgi:hypothetical protein